MCSRPFRPASGGFAHLCRSRPRGSVHSLLPSQLYVDHSHCPRACASYPSCVAVYPRDSRSRRVLCRSSHSLHSIFSRFRLLAERPLAACAWRAYTGAMGTAWKKIRYRLEWLALKSATKFVPILSRKACYRLALLLGSLGASLDRRGRRVALSNLRVAFGDEISAERRAQIVRESYQHFARTMLDFFWSPRLTSQNFSRYVEFENRERWDEENTRPGKPVVVGCYHYSNFEWLSIVSAFAGLDGVVIAQQFKNPLLDPIFLKLRQRSGHRVAPRKGAVMHLFRALRRGERFALLVDLTISAKLPTVAIKCFGLA